MQMKQLHHPIFYPSIKLTSGIQVKIKEVAQFLAKVLFSFLAQMGLATSSAILFP
jgi:hypothetical protein